MNRKLIIIVSVLAAVGFASCGKSYQEKQRLNRQESRRLARADSMALKVGILPTLDALPAYLAKSREWFDTVRVDIRLKPHGAMLDCDTALIGGSLQGAVTEMQTMAYLKSKGAEMVALGPTEAYWLLISSRASRLQQMKQFRHKIIGLTHHSVLSWLTDEALRGLKFSDEVFRVPVNDETIRLRMLLDNEIDAVWLTEPQATTALLAGHKLVADSRRLAKPQGVVAFSAKAMADKNYRRQIAAFVKGYNRACDSLNRYGLHHYRQEIIGLCQTNGQTADSLGRIRFPHLSLPEAR